MNENPKQAAAATVQAAAYTACIARRVAMRLWWVIALALAAIVVGAFVDVRLAIVGLMLLLIIFPSVMSLAVLNYALRPSVVALTRVESAVVAGGCLIARGAGETVLLSVPLSDIRNISVVSGRDVIVYGASPADVLILRADMLSRHDRGTIVAAMPSSTL